MFSFLFYFNLFALSFHISFILVPQLFTFITLSLCFYSPFSIHSPEEPKVMKRDGKRNR